MDRHFWFRNSCWLGKNRFQRSPLLVPLISKIYLILKHELYLRKSYKKYNPGKLTLLMACFVSEINGLPLSANIINYYLLIFDLYN